MAVKKVGILLFDEVEVLDFAGPFEVFSITEYGESKEKAFEVFTVAQTDGVVKARNGLKIQPDFTFQTVGKIDLLVIPGGYGAEEIEIHNKTVINWIRKTGFEAEIISSVCTGAFLLAEAGFLDGKKATTHWMDIERLKRDYPQVTVLQDAKFVDAHPVITSGGISAGINMSLYIVKKLLGEEIARQTARRMEFVLDI